MTLTWSGAPDLPQVPFGRLFRRLDRAVPEGAEIVTAYTDGHVTLRSNRAKVGYHEAADLSGFKGVEVGDFVVHGLDILRGSVGIADSTGAITAVCTVCEPLVDLDLRYVAHVIRVQAKSGFTRALARGIREGGADFRRWGTLAELPIPMPHVRYQRAVCDYLDRETARIDTLIEEQQRLIEMLVSRRSAVVDAVVTRGLDADSRLVDSGVDWIGPIPEGWQTRPLWSMFRRVKDVDHPEEQMLSVFRDYGVVAKDSRDNINKTAENRSIYQLVHPGWLVTNRMKAWQGSVGISSLRGIVSGHYICFAPLHSEDDAYLNWLFRSPRYALGYGLISRGVRIGQAEIDNDHYRVLPVVVPPLEEQRRIAAYLEEQTAKIDTLIAETERFIEFARERRAALITAAVTGQIDVREMA